MHYVYGPIPSRRLGRSLGVDPIPFKTCNWNCVYCQLGRTTPMTNERRVYVPTEALLAEVAEALAQQPLGSVDWVSFVGSGEPTLHADIGLMIRRVKAMTGIPVALITNGSLLYLPEVREALCAADAVLPTLVAGDEAIYRAINRPWPELTLERLIEGLANFRAMYHGMLWVEVMLIAGLNDGEPALRALADALRRIQPDQVHITLPDRPPAEPWVTPPDADGLMRATAILGTIAQVVHPAHGIVDPAAHTTLAEAILGMITRHPMREDDLVSALGHWAPAQVAAALAELSASGQAGTVTRYGQRFWCVAGARFAAEGAVRV